MKEKTIAKFKYEKNSYKLLEITIDLTGVEATYSYKHHYLITKNRKRIARSFCKETITKKFANIIAGELLQLKIY